MVTTQKTNKKDKPIGKPVLTGYQFTFNIAMNSSTTQLERTTRCRFTFRPYEGQGKKKTSQLSYQAIALLAEFHLEQYGAGADRQDPRRSSTAARSP